MKVELVYSNEQWQKIQEIANANGCSNEAVFQRRIKPPCDICEIKVTEEAVEDLPLYVSDKPKKLKK